MNLQGFDRMHRTEE